MIINKLKMINFRQYYDEQEIIFAEGDKNVTIIFGENGKGKTGIFRALIFGLYGETYINQDNKNDIIHLVNFNKLQEEEGSPVTAEVTVEFTDSNQKYIITRTIVGYKIKDKIVEEVNKVVLNTIDEEGNYSPDPIVDREEISKRVNEIFDSQIKDFFLFDAEKIDTLAKTNKDSKKQVEEGIKNLLHIDKLQKAVQIISDLYRKESTKISQKSKNVNLTQVNSELDKVKERILSIDANIELKERELEACRIEIDELQQKLNQNLEIKEFQNQIDTLKDRKHDKEELLKSYKERLREEGFNKGHMLLMEDYYAFSKDYLQQVISHQKDIVPYPIIEKSLEEMVCNCCKTDLTQSRAAYEQLLALKENYKRSELTPLVTEIIGSIKEYETEKANYSDKLNHFLLDIRGVKDEIEVFEADIAELKEEIHKHSGVAGDLLKAEQSLAERESNMEELKKQWNDWVVNKKLAEKEGDKLEGERKDLLRKDATLQQDYKKLEYIEALRNSLKEILDEYSTDMRERLMVETTEIFKLLIDRKDKSLINKIEINEKYEIEVINRMDTIITQDISQGQRQIVALSFITALAKVAGGEKQNINFPLFMDTPFGRVSGNNRDNLIENIPTLANQWILLLTDTELTINEESKLKQVGKLGRWYRLDQIADGNSVIKEVSLNDTIATRG